MIERIEKNEERLDSIIKSVNDMNKALIEFKKNIKNINLLKKYYGSKNWFKDKEHFENNKIEKIKAGVLSEDLVWNTLDDIDLLINDMEFTINTYKK